MFSVLNKLLPSLCLNCNKFTYDQPVCSNCFDSIEKLGQVFIYPEKVWRNAFAAFKYRGPIVDLIHRFKYERGYLLSKMFAKHMLEAIGEIKNYDAIVPVPLSRKSLIKRGYDQTLLLSKHISKKTSIPISDQALKCLMDTSQITKNKVEREKVGNKAFILNNSSEVNGKNILLVDDVLTTGSTASTCAKQLYKGGARSVDVLVIAKT